jgi:hypothetical protein
MDCCRSLAEWFAYVAALNVPAARGGYGLRERKPYRTREPVVGFGFSLGKVVFRVERGGVAVYSPLSAREYANYHELEPGLAKGMLVVAQLAALNSWDLTDDEMVEELWMAGFLDDLSPERPSE